MPPNLVQQQCSIYGPVFDAIDKRLRERYRISIKDHLGDTKVEAATGTIDPSMGGAITGLGGPREITLPGYTRQGKFLEGKTTLQGITFPPKNFQALHEAFKTATNPKGENAFHYHALKAAPGGSKIAMLLNYAEMLAYGKLLDLSYEQTKVGLTKATEKKAWGFREIADTHNVTVGALEAAKTNYGGKDRFSMKFGQAPASYARRVDISSLHVALTPEACNVHIDDVGFVLRGPKSVVGLTADFVQHLVNELLWKSLLRDWLVEKYGDSAKPVWAVEHLSLMLPSSDTKYAMVAGVKVDIGNLELTAAFDFGCKCLGDEKLSVEDRAVPIKDGWSVGGGVTYRF